jgi:hypothetical protein
VKVLEISAILPFARKLFLRSPSSLNNWQEGSPWVEVFEERRGEMTEEQEKQQKKAIVLVLFGAMVGAMEWCGA